MIALEAFKSALSVHFPRYWQQVHQLILKLKLLPAFFLCIRNYLGNAFSTFSPLSPVLRRPVRSKFCGRGYQPFLQTALHTETGAGSTESLYPWTPTCHIIGGVFVLTRRCCFMIYKHRPATL